MSIVKIKSEIFVISIIAIIGISLGIGLGLSRLTAGHTEYIVGQCFYRSSRPGKVIAQSDTQVLLQFAKTNDLEEEYGIRSRKTLKEKYTSVDCDYSEKEINFEIK